VLGISNLHISTIFLLNAGTVLTFFHFIIGYEKNPAELQLLNKNALKCVLTALHVNCMILFDKVI
jgi:hypothetical protein